MHERRRGKTFTFGPYAVHPERSAISFRYESVLTDGTCHEFLDEVTFPDADEPMWARLPVKALDSLARSLGIMLGISYWKPHLAPDLRIEGVPLTQGEAEFWNTMYTKGLGEYFYRSKIDFRGLVAFPFGDRAAPTPTPLPYLAGALVANGGGKDTVVTAELLKAQGIPFDLFVWDDRPVHRTKVAQRIGRPMIRVARPLHPELVNLWKASPWQDGFPFVSALTFLGVFAAALHGYRYLILSNEHSADIGNAEYLGMDVNHQWSKSTEAETLIQRHIRSSITPDIAQFSLLRRFTEIETTRRFAGYPAYFPDFTSCNVFGMRSESGWCGQCAKCVFIFACLTAFVDRATVVRTIGRDIYADPALEPVFKDLLGLEGIKPFECVGTPEEMIVAMDTARARGGFADAPAMALLEPAIARIGKTAEEMRKEVLSEKPAPSLPPEFACALAG